MRFMGDFLKNINWKHVLIMCIGNVFAGMGIGIFKLAGLGTDPFSGMNMAVADMIGMAFGGTVCGCCDLLSGTVDVSDAG